MNFYKRHIGDYLKDTSHLSLLEHGVYSRLLDVYYTRESGIPDAQAVRLVGARSREECAALKVVLEEFFELIDGVWVQDRCEREIHAAGPKAEDVDHAPAKSGKALRQQAYRERRAALFEALRERGVTMPFKSTMEELQDALLSVTKKAPLTDNVMHHVTDSVMQRVTDEQHNVTATISQIPDTISQNPGLKNKGSPAAIELPEWLPVDAWNSFIAMRKKIKAPMTPDAERLAIGTLEKLMHAGHRPRAVLEQSTLNSWRGLFEIKQSRGNGGHESRDAFNARENERAKAMLFGPEVSDAP